MKRKLAITAIVALAIGFVGLAGGFTKSETWHHDPCEQHSRKTQYDEWHKCITDVYYFEAKCDVFMGTGTYDPNNPFADLDCDPVSVWLNDETMSYQKVVFDPRSTAMFAIGGVIILLSLYIMTDKMKA